ncbi:DUF3592 domain-containing protein [Streptomyces sp. NBC_01198]|uniref:DUF3592 domain-containing protein n=1 Tax=Streptomyces sp. NBC_01198 TaxID=2903769 RepID=UPI002E14FB7E|nr:DUF3592 domain-containing protein [Streptomyces sp. NBC_01198]
MFAIGGVFGVVFGMIGLLFACAGAAFGLTLVRRTRWRRRALAQGLTAEARCLETYVARDHSAISAGGFSTSSATRHVILGFRTRDGRDIRIEETSRVPRVVGDFVEVRYLTEHPERATVAGASPSGVSLGLVVGLAFCAVFTCVGLLFAATGFGIGYFGLATSSGSSAGFSDPGTMP